MLACLYILDMSVIIKSNTLLPLVGARTTCFTPLLLKGLMLALLTSPQITTLQSGV